MLWLPKVRQLGSGDAGLHQEVDSRARASDHALHHLLLKMRRSTEQKIVLKFDFLCLYKGTLKKTSPHLFFPFLFFFCGDGGDLRKETGVGAL